MANASAVADTMIKEYLVFRGFTSALKAFEIDSRNDKNKSFRVDNIIHQFSSYIHSYDVILLRNYWIYFDKCYFSRLGHDAYRIIKKLEVNVLRLYIVHALQNGKLEKVQEFFEKYSNELQHEDAWKEWFLIPFVKNPEQNKVFGIYFTKIWQDSVMLSLSNCLNTVFSHMNLPVLLNFEEDRKQLHSLEEENKRLQEQIAFLHKEVNYYKSQLFHDRITVSTQTVEVEDSNTDDNKIRRKPTRFGWKLLGTKDKDVKSAPSKDTNTLRSSLDENMFQKLLSSTSSNNDNQSKNQSVERKIENINADATGMPRESQSTFYRKSFSSPSQSNNDQSDLSLKENNLENIGETPFIVLSQDEFHDHNSPIVSNRFSDNGNSVASLDMDGNLKIWECYPSMSSSASVSVKDNILSFDWLRNMDNRILIGKSNGTLTMYDTTSKKPLWDAPAHPKYKSITCVACSPITSSGVCSIIAPNNKKQSKDPQSNLMIKMKQYTSFNDTSTARQGALVVWDLQTGQQKCELCLDPFPVCIHCLSYNHNGSLLVTGGADGMIRLFDSHNSDCLVGWHAHSNNVIDVMFSSDETSIYSLGSDGKLCVWDINQVSYKIAEFPLHSSNTGISYYNSDKHLGGCSLEDVPYAKLLSNDADGDHVMMCHENSLLIYQASPKSVLTEVMSIDYPGMQVLTLDWTSSPNCSTAMCGTKNGTVCTSTLLKR